MTLTLYDIKQLTWFEYRDLGLLNPMATTTTKNICNLSLKRQNKKEKKKHLKHLKCEVLSKAVSMP